MIEITALYTALLAIWYMVLTLRTIKARNEGIPPEDDTMMRKLLLNRNFAEFIPMALLLMAGAEFLGAEAGLLHGAGIILLLGRALHFYGLNGEAVHIWHRTKGMQITISVILALAFLNIYLILETGLLFG